MSGRLNSCLEWPCFCFLCVERCQVEWKKAGEAYTIECRTSDMTVKYLDLCTGLCENDKVVYADSKKVEVVKAFRGRTHVNGTFPNMEISIQNLTSADTALYWCVYKKVDETVGEIIKQSGGSVVLVVTGGLRLFFCKFDTESFGLNISSEHKRNSVTERCTWFKLWHLYNNSSICSNLHTFDIIL